MSDIPQQSLGADICANPDCGQPIHLANTQLGPEWRHHDSPWCGEPGAPVTTKAVPAGRPWPEVS